MSVSEGHWILSDEEIMIRNRREMAASEAKFHASYMVNPSPRKLMKAIRSTYHRQLRGFLVNADLYWWDAGLGTHGDAWRWLFPDRQGRSSELEVELHTAEDHTVYLVARSNEMLDKVIAHPSVHGHLQNGELVSGTHYDRLSPAVRPVDAEDAARFQEIFGQ